MKSSKTFPAFIIILIFLLCFCLQACGNTAPPEEPPAEEPASEPSVVPDPDPAPAEDSSPPDTPGPADADVPAVRTLSCLSDAAVIQGVIPGVNGDAFLSCYPAPEDMWGDVIRVDLENDKILTIGEDVSGWPLGCRSNGQLVTVDYGSHTLRLYDADLSPAAELPLHGSDVRFSRKEDAVYLMDRGRLTRMDFDGREDLLLSFSNGTTVDAVDPETGMAIVLGRPVSETATVACMVYSLTGEQLFCRESDLGPFSFAGGRFIARDYGNGDGKLMVCDPEAGWVPQIYACPIGLSLTGFSDTTLVGAVEENEGETDHPSGIASVDVSLVNVRSGDVMDVCSYPEPRFVTFAWDEESDIFLIGASGSGGSDLMIVDPHRLAVSRRLSPAEASPEPEEPSPEPLPEHLSDLRIRADSIEESYGIRILLGDEAARAAMGSDYDAESTSAEPGSEYGQISSSLNLLEEALAVLPDGFTSQFLNYNGEAGLRFLFVHSLTDPVGTFDPAGVTFETGGWYNIAVETGPLTVSILHHELWHAVEDRMDADGFSLEEDWAQLNPEGFMYVQDRETYREEAAEEYILGVPDHDSVYFLRDYSMLNDREDRATMIEFLFEAGTVRGQTDFLQYYPHLAAKLDCLTAAVASFFGSVYWLD